MTSSLPVFHSPEPSPLKALYEEFIRDRRFTKGVSANTVRWYRDCWQTFASVLDHAQLETLSKESFYPQIELLQNRDVKAVSINSKARPINTFLRWLHTEGKIAKPVRIPKLKEAEVVIPTYPQADIDKLIAHRSRTHQEERAQRVAMVVIDTGMRLNEILCLRREDIDLENLLITIRHGKGNKQRVVPCSFELGQVLYRYMKKHVSKSGLAFFGGQGTKLNQNDLRRDFNLMKAVAGIKNVRGGFHVLRHTFAVAYVRNGGNVFQLQRILGHSTLDMTRRYVNLQIADLQAVHQEYSLFARSSL